MIKYTIEQLPSGFWCVRANGIWIDASAITEDAAKKIVRDNQKGNDNVHRKY